MIDLLERLEAMGRAGGFAALGVAAVCGAGAVALVVMSVSMDGVWSTGGLRFAASFGGVGAMVFGLLGARLLTQRHYPSADEVFPPLEPEAYRSALRRRDGAVCTCTRCRIVIDAAFSTGGCPVCGSSVDYIEVDSDDDAEMAISAAGMT